MTMNESEKQKRVTVDQMTAMAFDGGLITLECEDELDYFDAGSIQTGLGVDLGDVVESLADIYDLSEAELRTSLGEWLSKHGPDHISDLLFGWIDSLAEGSTVCPVCDRVRKSD